MTFLENPIILILVLLFVEMTILWLSKQRWFSSFFDFLPPVFWIYFIPMLLSTFKIIPPHHIVYSLATTYVLPASLFLLLVGVDLKMIFKLGTMSLSMFAVGALGIMTGTILVFNLAKHVVGNDFGQGFACLSASWTGGSANMAATKVALGTPDAVFAPMVIVDTIVPYVWMGVLMMLASHQTFFNRWTSARVDSLDNLNFTISQKKSRMFKRWIFPLILMASLCVLASQHIASFLPTIKSVMSQTGWVLIVLSTISLLCSLTPMRKFEDKGASQLGYYLLYFFLTTIGAGAAMTNVATVSLLILCGFGILLVHVVFMVVAAKIGKVPLALVAAASQANVGGVASAPVVAEIYHSGLASVGLLLAILGNIVGTYIGITVAHFLTTG